MEIEAKFAIPNRQAYRSLLRLRSIAGFTLTQAHFAHMVDHYVDTADARLLDAGYACRLRTEGDTVLATLKALGDAADAIHRRDEQEVQLEAWNLDVNTWPESSARELALSLAQGEPLKPLLDLDQRRGRANVVQGERVVAQWSLDEVRASVGRRPAFYYELEVELAPDGTEDDLAAIANELQKGRGLVPERRSKFQRALATLRDRGTEIEGQLSNEERETLEALASGSDRELARRAAVVLGWADGLPTREIVETSGLSSGRVRYWLRVFRVQRMAVFEQEASPGGSQISEAKDEPEESGPVTTETEQKSAASAGQRTAKRETGSADRHSAPQPRSAGETPKDAAVEPRRAARAREKADAAEGRGRRRVLPTVIDFCKANGVDMAHARFVANCAERLFAHLRRGQNLPRRRRKLLVQAAYLSSVGAAIDPNRPQRAGRDLILAQPLHGVSTNDRLALACIVAFQREKAKPDKEPTMAALEPQQRELVLSLSALLQVAEALDFSRTQSTAIESLDDTQAGRCEIVLSGPVAEVDALQATDRSVTWFQLHEQELVFLPVASAETGETEDARQEPGEVSESEPEVTLPIEVESIQSEDPMSEAGRKVLLLHFGRMLANEAGTRAGEDIEALHDMRVATRRMRAAYGVFGEHFEQQAVEPFNKALRRTGRALGTVRDLDVLIEKAEAFQASFAPEEAEGLEPLLEEWHTRREVARRQMLEYLDSKRYHEFVQAFGDFLITPGAGARCIPAGEPIPHQVRHIAPRLIFTRYEAVRAYEPIISTAPLTTYHMLRIDCKRLRYGLEFFRDVLGPEAPALIKQVTGMQDLLGALQDAHVAEGLIDEFLRGQTKRKRKTGPSLEGVRTYLAAQHGIQEDLLVQFPGGWAALVGHTFRRELALAVAAL